MDSSIIKTLRAQVYGIAKNRFAVIKKYIDNGQVLLYSFI